MNANMTEMCCGECGINFAVPDHFYRERKNNNTLNWYCPNGHVRVFRESEADKLRRERDRLTQQIAEKDDEIKRQHDLREATERRLTASRGQITKIKKRVGNGVCPCCNRTFGDLAKHMGTKHPTYHAEAAE